MPEREIIDEIGRFREKLLELSNRNPLLSYRKTKLKTLEFVGESPDQVYSRLVDEGKRFRFACRPEEELFPTDSENGEAEAHVSDASGYPPAAPSPTPLRSDSLYLDGEAMAEVSVAEQQSDGLLQTSLSEARLETVLKHIRREANTAIEETGVNFLYLVVGMLAWREDANSERTLLAPLLLVPVEIDRDFDARSQRYRYAVKWREEEVQDNLCLLKRLEKDFGMRLPRFDQDQTPEQYFAEIEQSVCSANEWTVERSALIGFFSFQKLLMYLDIDPENWSQNGALEEGSIVHDLVWGTDENAGAPLYASDYEIDNHPVAHDVIFPLDADSSQHSALVDIQSGKSLVIEGPPGTGKSQTITNAIAAALHQGKNVLFVAEKLTALEVVREKLDRLGLADFCLELHSDAASPRLVYESLRRRLEHSYPEPARLEDLRAELERKQRQIADYLQVTSQIVGPYKEPLYDLMWRVTNLRALRFSRLRGADVDTGVTQAVLNENAELLDAYAETLGELDAPKESPWWGCWLDSLNPNDTEWVDEVVAAFREHATQAEATATNVAERFGAQSLDWLDKRLQKPTNGSDLALLVEASKKICRDGDLRPLQQNLNRKLASQLEEQLRRWRELRSRVDPLLTVELPEAAKASRALCDACDPAVVPTLTGSSMGELKTALDLMPALQEMLSVDADPIIHGGSREKLCRKLDRRYETTLLETISDLHCCGEDYAAAAASIDSHCTAGIAEWFAARRDRPATIDTCRELEDRWPQALDACDVRHFIAPDTRSLARNFLRTATEHQDLKRQLAQKAFTSTEEASAAAEAALAPLRDRLAAIPVSTSWGELKQLRVRLKTLEEVLGRWEELAGIAQDQGLGPCRSLREVKESLYLCQLVRHSIVAGRDTLPAELFFQAAEAQLARGRERCKDLCDQATSLAATIDLKEAPDTEELTAIVKTLRIHSGSFFRFLNREYRVARRSVAGFSRGVLPKAGPVLVKRLERFLDWNREKDEFAQEQELARLYGDAFRGIETDWEQCDKLFKWALVAKSKGLEHSRACELLGKRDTATLSSKQFSESAKTLAAELADASTLSLLGFGEAANAEEVQLHQLQERAVYLREAIEELEGALSVFAISDQESLAEVEQFCAAAVRCRALQETITDGGRWEGLGELYRSLDTPIAELAEVSSWCEALVELDLPQGAVDWLLAGDTSLGMKRLAAGLEGNLEAIETWQAHRQHAPLLLAWIETVGRPLASALQQASPLAIGDSDKLEDALGRCRLILDTHQAEESITDQKKWGSLGDLYRGVDSEPADIAAAVEWTSVLAKTQLPDAISSVLAKGPTARYCLQLAEWTDQLTDARQGWLRCRKRFEQVGEVSADWMPWRLPSPGGSTLSAAAGQVLERASELPAWAAFCRMRGLCQTAGLTDFANAVLDKTVPPDRISGVYRITLLEAIAEKKIADSGLLRTFSRATIEKARRKYQELDRELLAINSSLVAHHASQHQHIAPAGNSTGRVGDYTEMGLIRHEIQKQRRHCRIRDLLTRAGNAAQALKPCFMMSPLSVSQYLDPEGIQFDLVVMDEASQIKPEDAIGVLLRAKQIVVVGDPKQLPPSSYFDRVSSDVADDDATQFDNTESVLEVAMKAFQPVRRLRWHYRSLHESLIHFSNDRFYDGDLVVFPSPSTDEGALGLRFHYVENACFDKGANQVEAERVAQAIVDHAKANPQESLAVASFNAKQSGLIQDLLESLCVRDEEARLAVEALNENERLLIKNLENLQGDERDVVFISYTYGPDPASGRVMNRFGPITGEAGWRRLNVLVSRARRRVEVFSSMRPADIQSGPNKSRGVTAFRDYLEYVQTGFLPDRAVITDRPMDSPFEEAVGRVITGLGYEVVPQVGVAGYFIDFGIRLPGQEDFLLGVECDGATYHSSKSARDRDRLREEVIRSRGWDLHRIWSTDWYLNQKHEEERLAKRIAELIPGV